ncbi:MAG TPA: hypothetical protein VG387_05800, partial [Rhizomicrobium sp.]|nr:hypothetical protein [Rhizomicrobium sp.]
MTRPTWAVAFGELPLEQQEKLTEKAHSLERDCGSFGHYILRNLYEDRFICREAINCIFSLLLSLDTPPDYVKFKASYIEICHAHSLRGGEIGLHPAPPRLGRAVDRSKFSSWL